ncbi:MAG: hypothetical protein ACREBU_26305 [Nitrososphaera sp.]
MKDPPDRRELIKYEVVVSYLLICEGGHGTTGTARWHLGADQIRGTLDIKLART